MTTIDNHEDLHHRIKDTFLSNYLTIVSIVQGGALGYAARVIDTSYSTYTFGQWILVLNTLLIIIITWHAYMINSNIFKWIPALLDSSIPFCLGAMELILIKSLSIPAHHLWYFFLSLYFFIAIPAYMNMYIKTHRFREDNKVALKALQKKLIIGVSHELFNQIWIVVCACAALSVGIVGEIFSNSESVQGILPFLSSGVIAMLYTQYVFYWNVIVHLSKEGSSRNLIDSSVDERPPPSMSDQNKTPSGVTP